MRLNKRSSYSSSGVVFSLYSILGTLVALSSLVKVCPVSTRIFCSNVYSIYW